MNFDNKGQASAEFIFVTLIVILIIGGMVSLIGGTQDQTQSANVGAARIMGEKIAATVNTVYINGNGYSIDLDLRTLNSSHVNWQQTLYIHRYHKQHRIC